ncbi:diphthine methyl ester synthase [Malassezia yamatoensis]|uniref:diphthine methyl ester synthase n=1 Tax=Malassezia yamatoensis TaxID=253288 RepID=A0AAJ6CHI2_9BASI|nr:diphthine methyl ester synthase [Malassezia yamatoensis]
MTLFLIGLGLADENDITLKGLRAVQSCDKVYLESYTSILLVGDFKKRMEALYGKEVILAHRETVELEADDILLNAHNGNVAFLVVGDPLSATTHSDLILRARTFQAPGSDVETPVDVKIIHNASITTALGSSGLAGYNFGQTISVPFWTDDWRPDSWLERIGENSQFGLHTLCLSDIKVREQSIEDMSRMGAEPEANRRGEMIVAGTLGELLSYTEPTAEQLAQDEKDDEDFEEENPTASEKELDQRREVRATQRAIEFWGEPLHTLIVVGSRLHPMEVAYGRSLARPDSRWTQVAEEVYKCMA